MARAARLASWGSTTAAPSRCTTCSSGARYVWHGARNYVELDPVRRAGAHLPGAPCQVRTEHDFELLPDDASAAPASRALAPRSTSAGDQARLVQGRGHLRGARARLPGLERRRHRRLPRARSRGSTTCRTSASPRSGCCRSTPRRCATTATTSPTTAQVHPAYGTLRDFRAFLRAAHERGLRVITELVLNHTSDQHPWFQRARRAPRPAAASATSTCGATRPRSTPTRASSSRTSRPRTGRGTRSPAPTSGTASTRTSPTSTSRTPRCAKALFRDRRLLARDGRRRAAPRRRALPLRARGHELREPARDARALRELRAHIDETLRRTACCSPRRTSGPRTPSTTSATATSATWRSTSRSCRACSWRSAHGGPLPDHRHPRRRRRRSPRAASGRSSCATTTS